MGLDGTLAAWAIPIMISRRSISRLESMATFDLLQYVAAVIDVSITACCAVVPVD